MSKHLAKEYLYELPSGAVVHPSRLIVRDGTLMWKHVFNAENIFTSLPTTEAHESHIIKTAQRIEELNTWVSQTLEPWECLKPYWWYDPKLKELSEGIALYFTHTVHDPEFIYKELVKHTHDHEILELVDGLLYFQRC